MESCYSFCHKPGKEERDQQQLKIYQQLCKSRCCAGFFHSIFHPKSKSKNVKEIAAKTLPVSADVKYFGI